SGRTPSSGRGRIGLVVEGALQKGSAQPLAVTTEFHRMLLTENILVSDLPPQIGVPVDTRAQIGLIESVAAVNWSRIGHARIHDAEDRCRGLTLIGQLQQLRLARHGRRQELQMSKGSHAFRGCSTCIHKGNGRMSNVSGLRRFHSQKRITDPRPLIQPGRQGEVMRIHTATLHLGQLPSNTVPLENPTTTRHSVKIPTYSVNLAMGSRWPNQRSGVGARSLARRSRSARLALYFSSADWVIQTSLHKTRDEITLQGRRSRHRRLGQHLRAFRF